VRCGFIGSGVSWNACALIGFKRLQVFRPAGGGGAGSSRLRQFLLSSAEQTPQTIASPLRCSPALSIVAGAVCRFWPTWRQRTGQSIPGFSVSAILARVGMIAEGDGRTATSPALATSGRAGRRDAWANWWQIDGSEHACSGTARRHARCWVFG